MTNEERDIITQFIARVSGAQAMASPGSVPATVAPLPPVDREADQLIGQLFAQYPEARYRLTQTAFVQEHALAETQSRIQRLEADLQQTRQALAQLQQDAQPAPSGGGFLGGLFGGGRASAPPPQGASVWNQGAPQQGYPQQPPQYAQPQYAQPQYAPPPQYAPGGQPGMFQRSGSGFLGSALTTAAGVAGGMVAGNALMNLFSGGHGSAGGLFGGGSGAAPAASPWAAPTALPEPPMPPQDYVDQGSWNTGGADPGTDWSNQPDSSWADSGGNDWGSGGGSDDV